MDFLIPTVGIVDYSPCEERMSRYCGEAPVWGGDGYTYDDGDYGYYDEESYEDPNDELLDALLNKPVSSNAISAWNFYENFKRTGFHYHSTTFVPSGDKALDQLELAGRDIDAKYLMYAIKKSNDDPYGPFDFDGYTAWENEYYAKRDAAKKILAAWRSYKSK